ncbi:MAG: hypothetical protein HC897_17525 [Thermoanaerobaculia bacterium]|nr:hypothetical protein [Thermoanaerobaculia bacterium]
MITPTEPPVEGTELRLTLEPPALVDLFHNRPAAAFEVTFAWPAGDQLLQDTAGPKVDSVRLRGGVLEIELREPAELSSAEAALEIDGATATWTLAEDGYTLVAGEALTPGTHNLTIGIGALDLDGKGLVQVFAAVVIYQAAIPDAIVFEAPDPNEVNESTIGDRFGFHGLPRDVGTGLVYMRNRYFDPQLGRFITADPLGFVDGPSQYQGFGANPVNFADSLGLRIAVKLRNQPDYQRNREIRDNVKKTIKEIPLVGSAVAWAVDAGLSMVLPETQEEMLENSSPVNLVNPIGVTGSVVTRGAGLVSKAINLPSWRRIVIDMIHIAERHMVGGALTARRTVFPSYMSREAVEKAVRFAYRFGEKVGSQGERVIVRGTFDGITIEMWVNTATKTIETAYPVL